MRLTVVGCSGSIAGPSGAASCYLLSHDGFHLLLDLGSGAFGALQRHIRPESLDAVLLSHLHVDHFVDMTGLATYLRWSPGAPFDPMLVVAPEGVADRLAAVSGEVSGVFRIETPSARQIGPFELTFARVRHPMPCYAVRVSAGGRSLVFSGDTGPSPELVELARGADVLLCEATFTRRSTFVPDLHMTGGQAGEHARDAQVSRLIITHVPPWGSPQEAVADAAAVFTGEVVAAQPEAIHDI